MNEMYDCSGCFDRFGGVTEPDDGVCFMTNEQMAESKEADRLDKIVDLRNKIVDLRNKIADLQYEIEDRETELKDLRAQLAELMAG